MAKKTKVQQEEEVTVNRDVLILVDSIAHEKDVEKERVFHALEESLAFATKKAMGGNPIIEVNIDRDTGCYKAYRHWIVVDQWEDEYEEDIHMLKVDLEDHHPKNAKEFAEEIHVDWGRASAKLTKQIILQKLKELEQLARIDEIELDAQSLHFATVKGFAKGSALLEIGRVEALLPKSEQLFHDKLAINSRILVAIKKIEKLGMKTVVIASRASNEFMLNLLHREIAVIGDGEVDVKAIARQPGFRTKILVKMHDQSFQRSGFASNEAVRLTKGKKGMNVQHIQSETGENVDVYEWKDNIAEQIVEVFNPLTVHKMFMNEDTKRVELGFDKDSLGKAVGHKGTNVELASQLVGWDLHVMSVEEWDEREQSRLNDMMNVFVKDLDIDEDLASELVSLGLSDLYDVAEVEVDALLEIGLDEDSSMEIKNRALACIEKQESEFREHYPEARKSLSVIEGLSSDDIDHLITAKLYAWENVADLATDELVEVIPQWKTSKAQEVIMNARKHW